MTKHYCDVCETLTEDRYIITTKLYWPEGDRSVDIDLCEDCYRQFKSNNNIRRSLRKLTLNMIREEDIEGY